MSAADLWQLFGRAYLDADGPVRYREHHLFEHGSAQGIRLTVDLEGTTRLLAGEGNGPIDAAVHALRGAGIEVQVRSYEERSMGTSREGGEARACAFLEVAGADGSERFGVGIDANIVTASIRALVGAVNRLRRSGFGAQTEAA